MYIPCLVFFNPTVPTFCIFIAFACSSLPNILSNSLNMPLRNKWSRNAKQKHHGACTSFARHATGPQSEESSGSEYCITNDGSDASEIDVGSSNDWEGDKEVATSMEALQHLYAIFLSPYLCLKAVTKTWEKCHKILTWMAMYIGDSCMMIWWKNTAHKKATNGCTTLDAFIVKKVYSDV